MKQLVPCLPWLPGLIHLQSCEFACCMLIACRKSTYPYNATSANKSVYYVRTLYL